MSLWKVCTCSLNLSCFSSFSLTLAYEKNAIAVANRTSMGSATVILRPRHRGSREFKNIRTSGAKMITPMVSPTHQVSQLAGRLAVVMTPKDHSSSMPKLAAVTQARGPPNS